MAQQNFIGSDGYPYKSAEQDRICAISPHLPTRAQLPETVEIYSMAYRTYVVLSGNEKKNLVYLIIFQIFQIFYGCI